jgi:phenylpyruvate tautomerase PptA (4-oxalocrotonate tautomerase family)
MPITVSAPLGVLTVAGEKSILPKLTDAILEINGAVGNPFFTSMVGGHVEILDPGAIFAGGMNRPLVVVKLDVPNLAFNTPELRQAFIEAATRIVDECTIAGHEPDNTWVTIWNAPNGAWGIGGVAYSNDALIAAITPSSSESVTA